MRTAALIVGMFGGFAGVYFAQILVTGTALFGLVASVSGGRNSEQPLYWGLAALAFYTLGIIGGALSLQRPGTAAVLMFLAAFGGLVATIAVGPSVSSVFAPTQTSSAGRFAPTPTPAPFVDGRSTLDLRTLAILAVPFGGPALLLLGSLFAALGPSSGRRREAPARSQSGWQA